MNKILDKIYDNSISDSDIIQETESAKRENPKFDINYIDPYNDCTLLMCAVLENREELVEYILADSNVNVNFRCYSWGMTALHELCCNNNIHILELLLGHKDINVNVQCNYGLTGLHYACRSIRIKNVKELLLDARVNPLIRTYHRNTARDIAIKQGYIGIANMLKMVQYTPLLRIPNRTLLHDIIRMIIEEYI